MSDPRETSGPTPSWVRDRPDAEAGTDDAGAPGTPRTPPPKRDPLAGLKKAVFAIPPIWRDVFAAGLIISILMVSLWGFTGQPLDQAPLVVVESGSMMHAEQPYGRVGTIDPGDLILVKTTSGPGDIVSMYGARDSITDATGTGDRDGYGDDGDVIIYRPDGSDRETPIIHRVVTWVEVQRSGTGTCFSYHDPFGHWLRCRSDVHLPDIGIEHERDFRVSGWITKGDNPTTNREADQVSIIPGELVQSEWVIGKARGEIPWVGLLKFIIQGNTVRVPGADWCIVGQAKAPCDTFVMLWVSLGVLILVPLVLEYVAHLRRERAERAEIRREYSQARVLPKGPGPEPPEEGRAAHPPPKRVVRKPRWEDEDDR